MAISGKNIVIILLLLVILATAVFFRFWGLDFAPPGLYPDEAVNGVNALETIESGEFKVFYPENNGREGLYINVVAFAFDIFGRSIQTLRGVSGVFGVLAVLGLFFLSKLLWGPRVALLASYLMAVSFWAVNFSRIGFRAIMLPAVLVWSFYLFWLGLQKKKGWLMLLGGLVFGVGLHTYISFRIAPLILVIVFALFFFANRAFTRQNLWRWAGLFLFGAFVIAAPLLFYYAQNPADFLGRASQVSIFAEESVVGALGEATVKTLGMFNVAGDFNWRHNFSGRPLLFWPIGIGFIIGLGVTIGQLFKRKATKYHFLLAWFLIMLVPNFLAPEGAPHALRALGAMPAVFILSALGLDWLYQKSQNYFERARANPQNKRYQKHLTRIKREIAVLALVILVFVGAWESRVYFVKWAFNPNTFGAYEQRLVDIGNFLKNSKIQNRYVIVNEGEVLADGIHISAKTIEFVNWPNHKEITFINGGDVESSLPSDLPASSVIIITRPDEILLEKLHARYPASHTLRILTFTGIRIP